MTDAQRLPATGNRAALQAELRTIVQSAGVPVAFAGEAVTNRLRLTEFVGTRTGGLRNLELQPGTGLGGRVLMEGRPNGVNDYGRARTITHEYDRPVLAEGLTSLIAVPVRVGGRCRAVLYGAVRQPVSLGARVLDALMMSSQRLARELASRDEIDGCLTQADALTLEPRYAATVEEVRSVHSELRAIAAAMPRSELARRVYAAAQRLVDIGDGGPKRVTQVHLSRRETDVLTQVAFGYTNSEVAERLSLSGETVKAYLQSAMRKLDASTRHQAVIRARREMLLP